MQSLRDQLKEYRDTGGISGEIHPKILEAWEIGGIDIVNGRGMGDIEKRFCTALVWRKNELRKAHVHNCAESVRKRKLCERVEPYPSATHPYVFRRIQDALEHVHDSAQKDRTIGGLLSGETSVKNALEKTYVSP